MKRHVSPPVPLRAGLEAQPPARRAYGPVGVHRGKGLFPLVGDTAKGKEASETFFRVITAGQGSMAMRNLGMGFADDKLPQAGCVYPIGISRLGKQNSHLCALRVSRERSERVVKSLHSDLSTG